MLRCVMIYRSFTGNNLEVATDVGWVNAGVLDLIHSWASQYLHFEELFIVYREPNLNPLPLEAAAWKWSDRMAIFLLIFQENRALWLNFM